MVDKVPTRALQQVAIDSGMITMWQRGLRPGVDRPDHAGGNPARRFRGRNLVPAAVLTIGLGILTAVSFALTCWRWIESLRFPLHRRLAVSTSLPGLTLLKPLKGCDAETEDCLRSWFLQKYPGPVQILLGVASSDDPVCAIVQALLAEFPQADARLIICAGNLARTAKFPP